MSSETGITSYYIRPTTNPDFGSNPQSPPSLDPVISPRRYDGDESTRDSLTDFSATRLDGFDSEFDSSLAHRIALGIANSASQVYTTSSKTINSPTNANHNNPNNSPPEQQQSSSSSHSYGNRKRTYSTASNSSGVTSNGGDKGGGEKRTATKVCRVCGDKAFSYNFNVITCESCKAFFRRNANKDKEIRCPFNDQCDINIVSRRFCQRCRLQKCFRVGMKKEWIMSEEARLEKKQRILENRERRIAEKRVSEVSETVNEIQSRPETAVKLQSTIPAKSEFTNTMTSSLLPSPASGVAQLAAAAAAAVGQLQTQLEPIQPPVTSSTFRPRIYTDVQHQSNSSILAANEAAFAAAAAAATPNFVTNTQQLANQVAQAQLAVAQAQQVAQVAQAHQVAQAQLQQAQLEHHIQQQTAQLQQHAAQQVQQAAVAAQINAAVQHQQQQLATAIVAAAMAPQPTVQQQQNAVAAASLVVAAAAASASVQPPPPPLPTVVPPTLPLVDVPSVAQSQQTPANSQEYITLPKDVVMKLFETKIESDQQQQQHHQHSAAHPPLKCQCRCQCGRYPSDMLIVDKVMTDLLQTSSQQNNRPISEHFHEPKREIGLASMDHKNAASSIVKSSQSGHVYKKEETSYSKASLLEEEMDNVADCSLLTSNDQDNLAEVLHANETWASDLDPTDAQRHSSGSQSKVDIVNMADGAIRRLVKMTKKIASFRALDHHDQLTLLKNTCMEYLILRGAMSYNAKSNVWAGPTPNSGYVVKMDAMKETQANLFESSIRFYATFREEWRTNENVMLLLGMIVLFNPNVPDLQDPLPVAVQNRKYRAILKRLLYTLCHQDAAKTCREFKNLIDKLSYLRPLNQKAMGMILEVDASAMEPLVREMFVSGPVETKFSLP
uniref:Nuclear hormone receptor HR96 n=1 Tax=Acrobeloides nanus TaxID=290746 RepID=A0A914ED95_9BILA